MGKAEELIKTFIENPEVGLAVVKTLVDKYKPTVYEVGNMIMEVYKDFANNTEYPATVAKVKKNMYDAYIEAGFSEDQALALMINDNIQLMNNIKRLKKQSVKSISTKKEN